MMIDRILAASVVLSLAVLIAPGICQGQGVTGKKLRTELLDQAAEFWIYDDLKAAEAESRRTKKPLLLSLRCVP